MSCAKFEEMYCWIENETVEEGNSWFCCAEHLVRYFQVYFFKALKKKRPATPENNPSKRGRRAVAPSVPPVSFVPQSPQIAPQNIPSVQQSVATPTIALPPGFQLKPFPGSLDPILNGINNPPSAPSTSLPPFTLPKGIEGIFDNDNSKFNFSNLPKVRIG
eukprot:TRINITY_DN10338_c0_g1_i1.p2 TRINITY_DN10338_c0_g1~~TRINITY_DN10338_c0_g1_i1.p2  ORF type:complete len:161 (-),score=37.20 TRINITY_DN10338_c0_g1_i1:855-1337(-)